MYMPWQNIFVPVVHVQTLEVCPQFRGRDKESNNVLQWHNHVYSLRAMIII